MQIWRGSFRKGSKAFEKLMPVQVEARQRDFPAGQDDVPAFAALERDYERRRGCCGHHASDDV